MKIDHFFPRHSGRGDIRFGTGFVVLLEHRIQQNAGLLSPGGASGLLALEGASEAERRPASGHPRH